MRRVSVVTVCLNARDCIRLTLESVARQTFPGMEHVVIDGGSTDGTCDIVKEYRPVHFVSEKDNGVYDAMDKGAKAATGDIVIFLNAGDTFYDARCCDDVAAFFEETGADIVFGNLMPVYLDAAGTHDHGAFTAGRLLDLGYIVNRGQLHDESIHHQATFYRRWIFDECTYACEVPEATGEYNLLLKAVTQRHASVKHIPRPVSRFVLGGISTRSFEKEWAKYVKAREALRKLYFPQGGAGRVRNPTEFVHYRRADAGERRRARRIRAKQWIKQSSAFKVYDRLMLSQSARLLNPLMEQLGGRLDAQARDARNAAQRLHEVVQREQRETYGVLAGRLLELEQQVRRSALEIARLTAVVGTPAERVREIESVVQPPISRLQINLAGVTMRLNTTDDFAAHGYKVSSQWDEDGLIQYLVARAPVTERRFVEFGVGDYSEANTRFLLEKDNWAGLIMDSSRDNIMKVRNSELYWRHQLTAVEAFIDADNIDRLLAEHGMAGEIGILSIDVDGIDYWLWKAMTVATPQVVICEYNGIFGPDAAVTVPYDPAFDRRTRHYSWLYAGASLTALKDLGESRGYTLVGTSAGGNNAFFVRDDVMARSAIKPAQTPFTRPMFRESRNPDGSLSHLDIAQGIRLIAHLEVWDVRRERMVTIAEACGIE